VAFTRLKLLRAWFAVGVIFPRRVPLMSEPGVQKEHERFKLSATPVRETNKTEPTLFLLEATVGLGLQQKIFVRKLSGMGRHIPSRLLLPPWAAGSVGLPGSASRIRGPALFQSPQVELLCLAVTPTKA